MFYKKGIDITNDKSMFYFLKEHFMYHTLNSWNGLKSIANNVKLYNLKLDGDPWTALAFLRDDDYIEVNMMIRLWEKEHEGYSVGFNGRMGGYLVLYNKRDNRNVLPDYIVDYDYDDYKDYAKDYYGSLKECRYNLVRYTKLVQDFDKLCDEIRDYVNTLSKMNFPLEKLYYYVDDFNETYHDELEALGITPLKVEDDKVNVQELYIKAGGLWQTFYKTCCSGDYDFEIHVEGGYLWIE